MIIMTNVLSFSLLCKDLKQPFFFIYFKSNDNRLICLVEYLKQPESELGVENVTVQIKLRELPYPARGIAHVELTPDPTIHSMSPYKTMFR